MSVYEIVLLAHSYLRWLLVVLFVVVIARSVRGWLGAREWAPLDERLHLGLVALVDLQFLLGLVLYVFLSPITQAFFLAPGPAMKDATLRFFGVEHVLAMFVMIVVIHVGRVLSKRAKTPKLRHRRVWTTTLAAIVLVLVSIPWPFLKYGRPLFRGASAAVEAPAE
jgi:hypothetical protein